MGQRNGPGPLPVQVPRRDPPESGAAQVLEGQFAGALKFADQPAMKLRTARRATPELPSSERAASRRLCRTRRTDAGPLSSTMTASRVRCLAIAPSRSVVNARNGKAE